MQPHKRSYCNSYTVTLKLTVTTFLAIVSLFGCQKHSQQGLIVEIKEKDAISRLDLNRATVAELEELPGIGPKMAQKIVAFRQDSGPFRSVAELVLIDGMSDSRLRRIEHFIEVR